MTNSDKSILLMFKEKENMLEFNGKSYGHLALGAGQGTTGQISKLRFGIGSILSLACRIGLNLVIKNYLFSNYSEYPRKI